MNTIKTANFEAEYDKLINNIQDTKYITKTAILSLLRDFRRGVITQEATREFTIPKCIEMR